MPLTMTPAIVLPTAAPAVPSRGKGPRPVMNAMLHTTFSAVYRMPRRNGVRASPAARGARGVHQAEQRGRQDPAERREHAAPERHRREKRLVDRAVDHLGVVPPREAGDEDTHPAEHGHHERDDDDEDLNRDADRRVAGV